MAQPGCRPYGQAAREGERMAAIVPFPTSPRARRHKARLRRTAQPAPGPFTMPGPATPPPGHWHPSLGGGLPDGVA